tara:strand:+ start:4408 stop:4809 length:402 start_codon:yes stop_codon:yes gene_type:complete
MLQFTVDQEIKDTLTINGILTGLKIGDKITCIHFTKDTSLTWLYYNMKWFEGDFSDAQVAIEKGVFIKFDQVPFDKIVELYKMVDGVKTDKYIIPKLTEGNYGWLTKASAYPLLMDMQSSVPLLNGKLISGGY